MNKKFWVYPMSVYLAAAVIFSIGCADDKKKNRIPITNSNNPNNRNGLNGQGNGGNGGPNLTGDTDEAKNPSAVQTRFEKIEAAAVKATGQTTDDQINNKLAEINKGLSVKAVESLAAGVYEIKWIGITGKLTSKEFNRQTLLTAVLNDLNLEKVDVAFFTTAKEIQEAEKKDGTTNTTSGKTRDQRRKERLSAEEIAAERAKNKAAREQGKKRETNLREASENENFAKIFAFNYAFSRILKITTVDETVSQLEESNPAQVNLFLSKSAREAKLLFSKKDDGVKTISEAVRVAKAQANGTYKYENIEIAFSQTRPEELQLTFSEVIKSESGKSEVLKSVIVRYARRADSAQAPAKKTDPVQQTAATTETQPAIVPETKVEVK